MVLLFYKSQDDFKLTNSFSQTQKAEELIDHNNVSIPKKIYLMKERKFKKKHKDYYSKIHREVYELANSKQSISKTITSALNVIEKSLRRYGFDGVSLSFNGGKDSVVLLHLFAAVYYKFIQDSQDSDEIPKIQTLYITHPNPFDEVEKYVEECIDRYCLDNISIEGPMKPALAKYLEQKPNIKAILVGTRRNDPHGGKLTEFIETDPGWPKFMRVHPILDMHYTKVWEFLRTLNVPYCELYDLGYTSLGSKNNTYRNPNLRKRNGYGYDPAWKLTDESKERCGRENKKQEISSSQLDLWRLIIIFVVTIFVLTIFIVNTACVKKLNSEFFSIAHLQ